MSNVEQIQSQTAGSNKFKSYLIEKLLNETPNIVKPIHISTEDKEDLVSETGTYTIEDDLLHNKKIIDIETARAEIDEKFGIKRPEISDQNTTLPITPRRQTQTIRVRNKTYSLANDIVNQSQNLSCTSSETSSSHSISKLPKTMTYNVLSEPLNGNETSRTIATNVLLGDTESLIKELKKTRTLTQIPVGSNPENLSSSSASSSSTNLSNENNKPKMWTIPSSTSPIPSNKQNLESISTRATVNYDGEETDYKEEISTPKKTGGLAFEFSLTPDNTFVTKNLTKIERNDKDVLTNRSNESIMTITKGFELRKNRRDLASSVNTSTSFSSPINTPKSNATSGLSLGARIQEKAKENFGSPPKRRGSDSTTPTGVQYTNRTLYLRQQSAKAKRDSMEREKAEETRNSIKNCKPKEGILKKTPPTPNGRNSSLNRSSLMSPKNGLKKSVSKKTSRNASPTESPLMTGSLNLPNGSSLPINLSDSFQRRKMYDPLKSVQAEKLKRQKDLEDKKMSKNNSINDLGEIDYMSDSSSYNSLPHQQCDNQNKTYEKILQSTLQRLCIRLIQMSTGVLDKIGDNRSNLCDSIQCLTSCSELERMQILTKLVNNMQIVHDNMQVIDQTLSNQKMEDSYIKELTRIRQEVDFLKQSACLNSPNQSSSRSSVMNNSFETN